MDRVSKKISKAFKQNLKLGRKSQQSETLSYEKLKAKLENKLQVVAKNILDLLLAIVCPSLHGANL